MARVGSSSVGWKGARKTPPRSVGSVMSFFHRGLYRRVFSPERPHIADEAANGQRPGAMPGRVALSRFTRLARIASAPISRRLIYIKVCRECRRILNLVDRL